MSSSASLAMETPLPFDEEMGRPVRWPAARRRRPAVNGGAEPRERRRLVSIALLAATLLLLFGPGLREHARFAADTWHFNDDARQQTWPLLPASIAGAAQRWGAMRPASAAALVVAVVILIVLVLGGRGPGHAGLNVDVASERRPLYTFLARLPPDAMIAGWPGDAIDNVPYLSGRKILIGFETHHAYHKRYVEEMRRRMQALIDAYFARDVRPLHRLQSEFGVTHLLVNRDHYGVATPTYFKPFDAMIADAVRDSPSPPEALRQAATAAVFESGPLVVLDLAQIGTALPGTSETRH